MRFTPILLIYCVLMFIAAIAVRELNKCTVELQKQIEDQTHE